ncbi:hypothetical protein OG800_48525 [Streptomyces sp. NBC_00445]|uniref:hypothetical protein n=1 Tax=unclassified Streptomyces TaxID=2593676 RepID=UPI002E1FDB72|nr:MULTISPECIES: hypothetical protein [unclassified Streptomyces]
MTDLSAPHSLDTTALLEEYRSQVVPAATEFVRGRMPARDLREVWLPYFQGSFLTYERAVQEAWRAAYGPDHGIEPGPPLADPKYADQLRYFPVTISHNNLERLIDVLAVELEGRTAGSTALPERIIDFAYVIDALEGLMQSLANKP